jgi:hypothetical protein
MIIAVDFDGTCTRHRFPDTGEEIGAAEVLKEVVQNGHKIIVWTVRDAIHLENAVSWFNKHEIPIWGTNINPDQHWSKSPKCHADIFIDDMALGCPLIYEEGERPYVDWNKVKQLLKERKVL